MKNKINKKHEKDSLILIKMTNNWIKNHRKMKICILKGLPDYIKLDVKKSTLNKLKALLKTVKKIKI